MAERGLEEMQRKEIRLNLCLRNDTINFIKSNSKGKVREL
jgi:hypothetical protein